jgi:hypothetical protein
MDEKEAKLKIELINKLFEICGYEGVTVEDILDNPDWKSNYQMNSEEFHQWWSYCVSKFVDELGLSLQEANREASTFIIQYGFKLIDS